MFVERFWLAFSLIFLGSCTPVALQPPQNTSIYINVNGKLVERTLTVKGDDACRSIDPNLINDYKLPQIPDLKSIPVTGNDRDNAKLIIKELSAHIKVLRKDLERVVEAAGCGQKLP